MIVYIFDFISSEEQIFNVVEEKKYIFYDYSLKSGIFSWLYFGFSVIFRITRKI